MTAARPKTRRTTKPAAKKKTPARRSRVKVASGKVGRLALGATSASARLGGVAAMRGVRLLEAGVVWAIKNQDVRRLGALAFLGVCLTIVSRQVKTRVETMPRYQVSSTLELAGPPPGLSDAAGRDLSGIRFPRRSQAFDPALVPTIADRLGSLPWVSKVTEVRIEPPNKIQFALETRRPLARLGASPDAPLVTLDGAVIARRYGRDATHLPRFLGIPSEATTRARALEAGAHVLDSLGSLRERVASLDLTNLDGARAPLQSEVVLTLDNGLVVDWGRPGMTQRPQRPVQAKRAALGQFLKLPIAARATRVSVRWDKTTWLEKTTDAVARAD